MKRIFTASCCLVLITGAAFAQSVPLLMNYQGRLVDSEGVMSGPVGLTLRLYTNDTPVGGEALLYADSNEVEVVDGLYSTVIGDDTISGDLRDALLQPAVYVEAEINGTKLTPRQRLLAAGYAILPGVRGTGNTEGSDWSLVGGGADNRIGTDASYAVILGGQNNTISNWSSHAIIGGGFNHQVRYGSPRSIILGGSSHRIGDSSVASFIGGGAYNKIGDDNDRGVISGGLRNHLKDRASYSVIGGGWGNTVGVDSVEAFIGGGLTTEINDASPYSVIGGGRANKIGTNAQSAIIGGGDNNRIGDNSGYSTIAGGDRCEVGDYAFGVFLGGGQYNRVGNNADRAVIDGGVFNTIGENAQYAVIAGGLNNTVDVNAAYAFIAGGEDNRAEGQYAFAAGKNAHALHDGAFVWSDNMGGTWTSATTNEFAVRARGGVWFETASAPFRINGGTAWHSGNDGSGSGLNADMLDGSEASVFFALSQDETVSGRPAFNGGTSGSTSPFTVGSTTRVANLNADTVDGKHASDFASASGLTSDYVPKWDGSKLVDSTIRDNGTVGIGGSPSGSYALRVAGDTEVTGYLKVGSLSVGSDFDLQILNGELSIVVSSERYKNNIEDLPVSAEDVLSLRPVQFTWKRNGKSDFGLIAEEVAETVPRLAIYKDGRPESVKYDHLAVYLLGVVQEQDERIRALEERLRRVEPE